MLDFSHNLLGNQGFDHLHQRGKQNLKNYHLSPQLIFVAVMFFLSSTFVQFDSSWAQALPPKKTKKSARPSAAKPSEPSLSGAPAKRVATGAISKISIRGNKKIEADAIRAKLKSLVGLPLVSDSIREDVQSIFKMGYFYDVTVEQDRSADGIGLTYVVVEKPSMVEILYEGNDEISDDDLSEGSGLKPYEILDHNRVNEAVTKMQKLYEDKGYFLAKIETVITDVEKNESVKVQFKIQENDKVKVKKITFLGNRNLPDGQLKARMATQEGGFFSFVSGSGSYKQDLFDRDVQVLSYVYFNEGYVQVKIDRPQVYVTPDKKSVYITIRIEEGDQFSVGSVDFSGDLIFTKDELFESTEIQNSGIFVYETLQKDLRSLQAKYGDLGYAFANIIPRTQVREKDKLVDIMFEIDKGNKVYFGEINVVGNSKTRDKVVRRELKIREGELYHETRRRESLENVKRLGYFEDVNFNTSTPPDKPDILNVDIVVKERNTGSIQVGAGYSTYSNFIFNGRVDQTNLFGRGQKLGVSLDFSQRSSSFNLNFTEPYFLDSRWSVGFDAYQSLRDLSAYRETKSGGAVRFGHPLAEYLNGYIRYKNDYSVVEAFRETDTNLFPVKSVNGVTSSVTFILEYDKRDDSFSPTKGFAASTWVEFAGTGGANGLGGHKEYTVGQTSARFYQKIFWDVVFRNNLTYGFITAPPGREPPFNELFLLGGANTLRGYQWFSVGKKKLATQGGNAGIFVPFGGRQKAYYNGEFEFPLIKEAGIKGVLFYDAGTAEDQLSLNEFRHNVGFGFRWFSPIGPLRFEWGFPLARRPELGESPVNFEFSIGAPF
jgi:outer membrane protein insertion porin family